MKISKFTAITIFVLFFVVVFTSVYLVRRDLSLELESRKNSLELSNQRIENDLFFVKNLSSFKNSLYYNSIESAQQIIEDYVNSNQDISAVSVYKSSKSSVVSAFSKDKEFTSIRLLSYSKEKLKNYFESQPYFLFLEHLTVGNEEYQIYAISKKINELTMDKGIYFSSAVYFDEKPDQGFYLPLDQVGSIMFEAGPKHFILLFFVFGIFSVLMIITKRQLVSAYQGLEKKLNMLADGDYSSLKSDFQFPFGGLMAKINNLSLSMKEQQEREKILSEKAAISNTIQMVAHDVRKPFGLVELFMMLVEDAETSEDFIRIKNKVGNKISNAKNSVNSMLADITDFGHDLNLDTSKASISNLFYLVFNELAQIYSHDVSIEYHFHHEKLGLVDVERFKRVFSNIISNAIQAIASSSESGKSRRADILIRTEDSGNQITVQIKNTGSFISKEDLPSVFDSFFTKGKSKGTGLGLAIAKKITEAHGGKISVDSSEEEQFVEFTLVLPSSDQLDPNPSPVLPNSLAGYQDFPGLSKKQNVGPTVDRKSRESMIGIALKHAQSLQRKIRIGMLDDEDIYRQSMQSLISSHGLSDAIELVEYSDPNKLLNELQESDLDLLISDIDLSSTIDGYELMKIVSQKMGSKLPICMHSNKATFKDAEKGYESGASAFMPKPMTVDHLLKFVVESLKPTKKPD